MKTQNEIVADLNDQIADLMQDEELDTETIGWL
jgi:hypothetical protein